MRQSERRRSLRRFVTIECHVQSAYWEGTVPFAAADVSLDGIWLVSDFALEPGQEVCLSFVPPGQRNAVCAAAKVARVGSPDGQPAGMGLEFIYLPEADRACLAQALEGRPPKLPGQRLPRPLENPASLQMPVSAFGLRAAPSEALL